MQIGIPCVRGSYNYAELLVYSIAATISNKSKIELLLTVPEDEVSKYKKMLSTYGLNHKIITIDNGALCNRAHGNALNILFQNMTHSIGGFIDCDVAILEKQWDKLLLRLFSKKTVIIGSSYWQKNKYSKFPNVIFCLFKTQIIKECGINFEPANKYIVEDDKTDIYSRPVGYELLLDTGYELPLKLKSNGYNGYCLSAIRSFDAAAIIKARKHKKAGEEYHLNKVPVCTHFRQSSNLSFDNRLTLEWRRNVKMYLRKKI